MALVRQPHSTPSQSASPKLSMPIAESSFLMNVDYDPQNLQMTVTMKNGGQYIYHYVYPNVFQQFQESHSKGEFYAKVIRGKMPGTRIVNKTTGPSAKAKTKK
jgi:hypothetical protein